MPINIKTAVKGVLKKFFSPGQREKIKQVLSLLKRGPKGQIQQQIGTKLLELGFTERAIADLDYIVKNTNNKHLKKMAAWELARWYANYRNEEGARCALEYLSIVVDGKNEPEAQRQAAVLQSECYDTLGDRETAQQVLRKVLVSITHPDLYLATANLQSTAAERLDCVNNALDLGGISRITYRNAAGFPVYDCLTCEIHRKQYTAFSGELPKITVIVPAYNSEIFIQTTLSSILAQTWSNLEVLVVDDCSTDATAEVVKEYQRKDTRVRLLATPTNSGPYVARNTALAVATGEFITTNDADDWSHPEKLEIQAQHLLQNSGAVANLSEQVRATSELRFYRRGNYGNLIFINMSSLMFRRDQVMKEIGYWDSVRFGADNEFIRRLRKVFGNSAVVELSTGPLSFQRQTSDSLTGNSFFGYHGYYMGARKEYFESQSHFHQQTNSFFYDFPQKTRPFPVPEPMLPNREEKSAGWRHLDVILMSDYRLSGEAARVNLEEIELLKQKGGRLGLVQVSWYPFNAKRMRSAVREVLDGKQAQILVYGEKISCDQLILRFPAAFQERQRYLPLVKAKEVRVVIELSYKNDGFPAIDREEIVCCKQLLQEYLGLPGIWHPLNRETRSVLQERHSGILDEICIAEDDWESFRLKEVSKQE